MTVQISALNIYKYGCFDVVSVTNNWCLWRIIHCNLKAGENLFQSSLRYFCCNFSEGRSGFPRSLFWALGFLAIGYFYPLVAVLQKLSKKWKYSVKTFPEVHWVFLGKIAVSVSKLYIGLFCGYYSSQYLFLTNSWWVNFPGEILI